MTDTVVPFTSGPKAVDPPAFKLPEAYQVALDLQRDKLFEAMAIVETAAAGIKSEYDCEVAGSVDFPRALKVAKKTIEDVAYKLDADALEDYAANHQDVHTEIERRKLWREDNP